MTICVRSHADYTYLAKYGIQIIAVVEGLLLVKRQPA
jgi:chorismate synthase